METYILIRSKLTIDARTFEISTCVYVRGRGFSTHGGGEPEWPIC